MYQKKYYDQKQNFSSYEEGDIVYKMNKTPKTGQSRKLQPIWIGPLLVVKSLSPTLYKVRSRKTTKVLHYDLLRKCNDREIPLWLRRLRNKLLGSGLEEVAPQETCDLGEIF